MNATTLAVGPRQVGEGQPCFVLAVVAMLLFSASTGVLQIGRASCRERV